MILKSIPLRCGSWEAEVLPSFGANLISLKKNGQPILCTPDNSRQLEENPCLYGNPLLFPPNRTANGRFWFEREEYCLPVNEPLLDNNLHGLLYNAPFFVREISASSVVCFLKNTGKWFPFCFSIEVSFVLDEEGLTQRIAIHNDGNCNMPILLGFHTSFVAPKDFSVPIKKHWETNDRHLPTGKLVDLSECEQCFLGSCTSSEGQVISGYYTADSQLARVGRVLYQASPEFTQWVLYNGGGNKDFLCVEPQNGPVNGLNTPGGYTVLPQGETARFWLRFTME